MLTPIQVAKRANIHVNTVRKWSADYADLLSTSTRGEGEARLFSDEDVDTICTIAALRRTGMMQDQIVAYILAASESPVIDVAPTQAPQSPHEAHSALQGALQVPSIQHAPYMALQRLQREEVQRALWSHGVAFYLGMVTMGGLFFFVWWLNGLWWGG